MKKIGTAILFIALALGAIETTSLNVKTFGAKGDGKSDDSKAFQRAIDAAFVEYPANNNTPKEGPDIVIPKGTYLLKQTLYFVNDLVLRGEGDAILKQADAQKDLLYGHQAGHGRFSNLTFSGGASQLRLWTNNKNASLFTIQNCRFMDASDVAVECLCLAKGQGTTFDLDEQNHTILISPYLLEKQDSKTVLKRQSIAGTINFFNSTQLLVEDSTFLNCAQAVVSSGDGTIIRRTKIETHCDSKHPALSLSNRSTLYDLDILVRRNPNLQQAVIGIAGSIIIDMHDSIVRTDNGKGVCLIDADVSCKSYLAQSILLQRLKTESAGAPENALIYFRNNVFPNIVLIDQVEDSGKGQVKAVGFDTPPDEQTITRSYPKHFDKFVPMQVFSFTFSGNSANIDTTLPEILQPFQKTIPHPLDKMMKLPSTPLFQGKELRAEEFGIIANTKQDDTAELKQLFAAAAKKPGATVILPGRRLKLTETLEIPKYIKVTAYGTAKLLMKDAQKDIFRINDPECVELSHLIFEGGRHFLNITSQPEKRGLVSIENCNGFSCSQAAIRAFSGNKQIRENNFLQLVICNGFWYVNRFYEGGANAYLDSIWLQSKRLNPISSTWIPPESVVIVNFGKLQLTSMLGVPLVLPKNSIVRPPGSAIGDHRWIDNHGELYCFNNRFGGERGGYCSIYHYGPAKTRIYGGYAWFNNDSSYKIPVLADTSNADVRAINLVCSPYPTEPIALRWRNLEGAIVNTTRQELYNIIPDTTIKPDDRNPREK